MVLVAVVVLAGEQGVFSAGEEIHKGCMWGSLREGGGGKGWAEGCRSALAAPERNWKQRRGPVMGSDAGRVKT